MAERPREFGDFKKARVNGGTDNDSLKDSHKSLHCRWQDDAWLKLLYLRSHLSYYDELLDVMHSATLHPTKSWKFEFLKIKDGGLPPFPKM